MKKIVMSLKPRHFARLSLSTSAIHSVGDYQAVFLMNFVYKQVDRILKNLLKTHPSKL